MNAELVLEFMEDDIRNNVIIADAALVEGAVTTAIQSSIGKIYLKSVKKD